MLSRLKAFRSILCLIIVCSFALFTYGEKNTEFIFSPENILAYIQITNPEQLMSNIDAFLESSQLRSLLNSYMGDKSCKELLITWLENSKNPLKLDWFNLQKPMGLAILKPVAGSSEYSFVLLFPLGIDNNSYEQLVKAFQDEASFLKKMKDYAVIANNEELLGTITDADISRLVSLKQFKEYKNTSVCAYLNSQQLRKESEKSKKEVLEELKEKIKEDDTFVDDAYTKIVNNTFDSLLQIKDLYGNMAIDKQGITVQLDQGWQKEAQAAQLLTTIPPVQKTKEFAKYIPVNSLFSFIVNIKPAKMNMLFRNFYDSYISLVKLEQPVTDAFKVMGDALNESAEYLGPRMAFALNFDLDPTLAQLADSDLKAEEGTKANLEELFDINLTLVFELKAASAYKEFIKKQVKAGTFTRLLGAWLDKTGVNLNLHYQADQHENDFVYDLIEWQPLFPADSSAGQTPEHKEKEEQELVRILNKWKIYLSYKNNRAYWVIADNGPKVLQALVEKDATSGLKLTDSLTAKELWKNIPDNAHMILQVSMNRILKLISKFSKGKMVYRSQPDAPGLIGYLRYDVDMQKSSLGWSAQELAGIINQLGRQLLESLKKTDTEPI